jgi:chromosome segregation ATPase
MNNATNRHFENTSNIVRLFYLAVFYLALTSSMSAQTTMPRAEVPTTDDKQMLQMILGEVRQLRSAVSKAQTNTSRLQIAIERLRRQQEQVDRLTAQLQETQNEAQMIKSSKPEMEEQVKELENLIQQAQNEQQRSEMQAAYKEIKNGLAQQAQREEQLEDIHTKITVQLQSERSKLEEMNNLLDSLQREMESQHLATN